MGKISGATLKTFSIGFDETGYSEAAEAAANARHLGTDHQATVLTGERVAEDLGTLIASLDHPTGDGINTYYASKAAHAGGVTVALSGLGADELFGGYVSFKNTSLIQRWLPAWRALPKPIRTTMIDRWSRGDTRFRKMADALNHATTPAALALLQRRVFCESTRLLLMAPDFASAYQPHPAEAGLVAQLGGADLYVTTSLAEMSGYMTDVRLRDSDVMSMRHSLELRVPFVDRALVRWLAGQQTKFKYTPQHTKSALAHAVADLLPAELLVRKKRGFSLPYAVWMRGPLKPFLEETFSASSVGRSGLFDPAAVQAYWRHFLAGHDAIEWSRVWSLGILIAFINRPRPVNP